MVSQKITSHTVLSHSPLSPTHPTCHVLITKTIIEQIITRIILNGVPICITTHTKVAAIVLYCPGDAVK